MISWIPHIPLIGGFPLGAEKALGTPPKFISSLDGFAGNDEHYINYMNNTRSMGLEYKILDPEDRTFHEKVNIVVSTPPCAALSMLNCGTNDEVSGPNCAKNDFMYIAAEQGIHCYDADVILIENAPALYTKKGAPVAQRLKEIAHANGYSLTLYKTSTSFHGLPQNRDRCFAFIWKNDKAPILPWIEKEHETFADWLGHVKSDALQQDYIINPKIGEEPFFSFIRSRTNRDARDLVIEGRGNTAFGWITNNNLLEECLAWCEEHGHEKGVHQTKHAMKKFAQGKGIWDGSTHVFKDKMNAVIGRNMMDTIHPTEDRSLTVREAFHMMGFPDDFELLGARSKINHIAQNVPVYTACDMVTEAAKFLNGKIDMSGVNFMKQNNMSQKFDTDPRNNATLEAFL